MFGETGVIDDESEKKSGRRKNCRDNVAAVKGEGAESDSTVGDMGFASGTVRDVNFEQRWWYQV